MTVYKSNTTWLIKYLILMSHTFSRIENYEPKLDTIINQATR